jgi:curved DNA-binding protein CbpA
METSKKRNRPHRKKLENYYHVLGVRSHTDPGKIKQAYIELVKQYTPEIDPDKFQQIRRAYEVLRDPDKRRQYDILRKYGSKMEEKLQCAEEFMEGEKWRKAMVAYQEVLHIDPEHEQAKLGLAQAVLFTGDKPRFYQLFAEVIAKANTAEKKVDLHIMQAELIFHEEEMESAYEILCRTKQAYPHFAKKIDASLIDCLLALDRFAEALTLITSHLQDVEKESTEDFSLYVQWLTCIYLSGKKNMISAVLVRFRTYLRNITDPDEREWIKMNLAYLAWESMMETEFIYAAYLCDLAHEIDAKDIRIRMLQEEAKKYARVQQELLRYQKDQRHCFPSLLVKMMVWLYGEFLAKEEIEQFLHSIPDDILNGFEEEIPFAILQLQKKYPVLYKYFQKRLSDIYEAHADSLNREQRRMLKRGKGW